MGVLEQAREALIATCKRWPLDPATRVEVRRLSPDEAIGERADPAFVVKQGKEVIVEATFRGARGQAFTDRPRSFAGTLDEVLALPLTEPGDRAILVATLNAVLRHLGLASGTVHCRNEDPKECGPVLAATLEQQYGRRRYVLVGLQPAILAGLAERFGPDMVRVLDLNPDNIGTRKSSVDVWDGATRLEEAVAWGDVVLATGSTVVNGSIDGLLALASRVGKPVVFFGNTISGVAALTGLRRLCPRSQ